MSVSGNLARISHAQSTVDAQWHALRDFRSVGLLNRVSTMPARPLVAKAAYHAPLSTLATIGREKCGLRSSKQVLGVTVILVLVSHFLFRRRFHNIEMVMGEGAGGLDLPRQAQIQQLVRQQYL